MKSTVKDNFFSENQIISIFSLLDREEKGVITLSDFTHAFVDVSANDSDALLTPNILARTPSVVVQTPSVVGQTPNTLDDGSFFTTSTENADEDGNKENEIVGRSTDRSRGVVGGCECPCSGTAGCHSALKTRSCMFDKKPRYLRESVSFDETPRSVRPDTRHARRRFPSRKISGNSRRGSLPSYVTGGRKENVIPKLLRAKRWKSYDYGMEQRHIVTVNENDTEKIVGKIVGGSHVTNNEPDQRVPGGESSENPYMLRTNSDDGDYRSSGDQPSTDERNENAPITESECNKFSLDSSDCFLSSTSSLGEREVTKELDEIFGGTGEANYSFSCQK